MSNLVKVFNSDQTDSPDLSGQVDMLCNILQKCLVDGYNQKSVDTLDLSNNVGICTTTTDHNFSVNDVVALSGASPSLFNDDFRITEITSSTTFKFVLIGDNQTASGTIICKYAPLGWTREFDGTNKSVYRAPTGSRRYLRIDDTNAYYALAGSYKTMSDVDTGTDLIPISTGNYYCLKSNAASSSERKWTLIGNNRTFYLFTASSSSYQNFYQFHGFGDYKSYESNFNGSFLIFSYSSSFGYSYALENYYYNAPAGLALTIKSSNSGINLNIPFSAVGLNGIGNPGLYNSYLPVFPNFCDFSLHLSPVFTLVANNMNNGYHIAGELPGIYYPTEITNGFFLQNEKIIINNVTYVATRTIGYGANDYGNIFFTLNDWSY